MIALFTKAVMLYNATDLIGFFKKELVDYL